MKTPACGKVHTIVNGMWSQQWCPYEGCTYISVKISLSECPTAYF